MVVIIDDIIDTKNPIHGVESQEDPEYVFKRYRGLESNTWSWKMCYIDNDNMVVVCNESNTWSWKTKRCRECLERRRDAWIQYMELKVVTNGLIEITIATDYESNTWSWKTANPGSPMNSPRSVPESNTWSWKLNHPLQILPLVRSKESNTWSWKSRRALWEQHIRLLYQWIQYMELKVWTHR